MSIARKRGPHRTGWIAVACLLTGIAASPAQTNLPPRSAARLPSVVIIIADGLGYGDLGCYGQENIQTPRIDQLAARSARFRNCHAGGGEDKQSRVTLLTGMAVGQASGSEMPTLAERLQAAGYHTGFIGYWGLGGFSSANAAQRRGFDEVVAYGDRRHSHDLYTGHLFRKDPYTGFEGVTALANNHSTGKRTYLPDLLTRATLKFCKQHKPERLNNFRPFLLVVSYPVPAAVTSTSGPIPESPAYADRSWPAGQMARANAITRLDQHVGELLDELDERGMTQNTIVLVTSSQGPEKPSADTESLKSTGAFTSGEEPLSEGQLRVPLIVEWPFWVRTNITSDLLLSGADIVPTLLQAARLEMPDDLTGISFLPTLLGQTQTNRYDHLTWTVVDGEGRTHQAVRRENWKAVRHGADQPWRLYNLDADPGERTDLADRNPEMVKKLEALLSQSDRLGGEGSDPDSGG